MKSRNNKKTQNGIIIAVALMAVVFTSLLLVSAYLGIGIFSSGSSPRSNIADSNAPAAPNHSGASTLPEQPKSASLTLSFFGDLLIHDSIFKAAKTGDTYDFTNQFSAIAPYFKNSDFVMGNLETTFAGKDAGYSNYPNFNCPEQLAGALRDVLKVDLISTVNNHSMDKRIAGLYKTLDFLDEYGVAHVGTYRSEEEAQELFIKSVNGVRVCILAYTDSTNGIPVPSSASYAVNLTSKDKIKSDAERAAQAGADITVLFMHWGTEYTQTGVTAQRELSKWVFENTDISLIVGGHPHVVQPFEQMTVQKDGLDKLGSVVYSLGNFTGSQVIKNTDSGIIANITLNYDFEKRACEVDKMTYIPTYIDRNQGSSFHYRIVNINKAIADYEANSDSLITKTEYNRMKEIKNMYKTLIPKWCDIVVEDENI